MRTTVELTEEQRAELLRLAAKRGLKGFSSIVQEALDDFLRREARKVRLINAAVALKGSLEGAAGERLEERTLAIRENWR